MADLPPFMNAYSVITKILSKIKEAKAPERFTQDYLATALKFSGGSPKPFIPLAKKLGLINSDGTPTELYHQFRNPNTSKGAMAKAIRKGYAKIFERNEYAHKLDKAGLKGLLMEITGHDSDSKTLSAIVGTFEKLKDFANFDAPGAPTGDAPEEEKEQDEKREEPNSMHSRYDSTQRLGLNYTINIQLPKTNDISVFNAIFKSLKENLL